MQIQRMAFIQKDTKNGITQQLFLLKSGHDLELECRVVNRRGRVEGESIRLAYTLDDKLVNQIDRQSRNSIESYDAWRKVAISVLGGGASVNNWPADNLLIGIAVIAEFGEPVWEFEEEFGVIDTNMLNLVRAHVG